MSAAIQRQMDAGAVFNHVSNVCPQGTKFHLLEVGWLECDEGFVVRGGNTSLNSTKDQSFVNKRRQLPMYCILIDHPIEGVILWETGKESGRRDVVRTKHFLQAVAKIIQVRVWEEVSTRRELSFFDRGVGPTSSRCVHESQV